jgi:hypothetical protein
MSGLSIDATARATDQRVGAALVCHQPSRPVRSISLITALPRRSSTSRLWLHTQSIFSRAFVWNSGQLWLCPPAASVIGWTVAAMRKPAPGAARRRAGHALAR